MCRIGYFLSDDPSIGRCVRASPGWMIRWFDSVSSAETAGLARTTKRGGRMATKRDEAEDASSADDACALTPSEGAGD